MTRLEIPVIVLGPLITMISFCDNEGASDDSVMESGGSKMKVQQSRYRPGHTFRVPEG